MDLYFEDNRYQNLTPQLCHDKKNFQKHYKNNFIGYFANKSMGYVTERYSLAILIDFGANKTKIRNFTTENEESKPTYILILAKKYFKKIITEIILLFSVTKGLIVI